MRAYVAARRPLALVLAHLAVGLALAGAVACGPASSAGPASTCTSVGPVTCPTMPPTYTADVQPILENRCYGCHGPGGVEQGTHDLSTYQSVSVNGSDILTQLGQCYMPPPDAGQPTAQEKTTVFEWIQCGKAEN
jgi:hypothetical protein